MAGQYWHVTLAQLLMRWIEGALAEAAPDERSVRAARFDMGAPGAMHRLRPAEHGAHAQRANREAAREAGDTNADRSV